MNVEIAEVHEAVPSKSAAPKRCAWLLRMVRLKRNLQLGASSVPIGPVTNTKRETSRDLRLLLLGGAAVFALKVTANLLKGTDANTAWAAEITHKVSGKVR
jgi:hypothetical protein